MVSAICVVHGVIGVEYVRRLYNFIAVQCNVSAKPCDAWKKVMSESVEGWVDRLCPRKKSAVLSIVTELNVLSEIFLYVRGSIDRHVERKAAKKVSRRPVVINDGWVKIL